MYVLVGNKFMIEWLNTNLKKYEKNFQEKYVVNLYKSKDFIINVYQTNTITIEGTLKDRIYIKLINICNENNYLGSDEVGVGDFFGPVIYCTVFFNNSTMEVLKEKKINIKDSKKIKDSEIINIYNNIKDNISYNYEIAYDINNRELNSIGQKVYNHHKNINKFSEENVTNNVIDLFTTEKSFFKYSNEMNIKWDSNIILETKADSKFLVVALASIIARAIFLDEIKKIEEKYNLKIPLGNTENVKKTINKFIKEYSKDELAKICKVSFKTFKEL